MVVKLVGDISQFGKDMQGAASTAQQVGGRMQGAGATMTAGLTLPILGAGVAVTGFANEFNAGMANVASLGPEAAAAIGTWGPQVQATAVAVGKGTDDMTGGLYNVVSAFGVADDTMQVLEINARATGAGLSTTAEAIDLTSAVTKGYGDTSAAAVQSSADLALKTVQLGQTTFPELASSIGAVVPLAASLGVTQEELFGVMATGTGVTGNASEVTTQLRGVLQSLMAPTGDMTTLFEEMGFANGEAMLETLGLQGTIEAITGAAEATGQPLQKFIGSIEGQTLAMALAGPQADVFTEKLAAMENASGAVDEAFAAQTQGANAFGFALQQAKVQAQVWAEQIGGQLVPVLGNLLTMGQPVIDWVSGMITRFTELSPQTQMIILGVVALVAAIGPLLVMLGLAVSGFGVVAGAIGFLMGPVGLIIAGVALLAAAWATNFGGIQEKTFMVLGMVQGFIQQVVGFVLGLWNQFGGQIMSVASAAWGFVFTVGSLFLGNLQAFVMQWIGAVQSGWDTFGGTLVTVATTVWSGIQQIVSAALTIVQGVFTTATGLLTGDWEMFGEGLQMIASGAWDLVIAGFEMSAVALVQLVGGLITSILDQFGLTEWASVGRDIVNGVADGISASAGAIANAARAAAQAALDAAKSLLGISSPSSVARAEVGREFGEGEALGILDMRGRVEAAARRLVAPLPGLAAEGGAGLAGAGGGRGGGGDVVIKIDMSGAQIFGIRDFEDKVMTIVDKAVSKAAGRRRLNG